MSLIYFSTVALRIFLCLSGNADFLIILTYFVKSHLFKTHFDCWPANFSFKIIGNFRTRHFFKAIKRMMQLLSLWHNFDYAPNLLCIQPSIPRLITFSTIVLDLGISLAIQGTDIPVPCKSHTLRTTFSVTFFFEAFRQMTVRDS